MNNDRPPALKLRKWLMRNKESTLLGLSDIKHAVFTHGVLTQTAPHTLQLVFYNP